MFEWIFSIGISIFQFSFFFISWEIMQRINRIEIIIENLFTMNSISFIIINQRINSIVIFFLLFKNNNVIFRFLLAFERKNKSSCFWNLFFFFFTKIGLTICGFRCAKFEMVSSIIQMWMLIWVSVNLQETTWVASYSRNNAPWVLIFFFVDLEDGSYLIEGFSWVIYHRSDIPLQWLSAVTFSFKNVYVSQVMFIALLELNKG